MCVFFCINALENPVFWSLIKSIHKHKIRDKMWVTASMDLLGRA